MSAYKSNYNSAGFYPISLENVSEFHYNGNSYGQFRDADITTLNGGSYSVYGWSSNSTQKSLGKWAHHNAIYRGKVIGASTTLLNVLQLEGVYSLPTLASMVAGDNLSDIYIGDRILTSHPITTSYGTIEWIVVAINYYSRNYVAGPHLVLWPRSCLFTGQLNTTNSTQNGFPGSPMFTTLKSYSTELNSYLFSVSYNMISAMDENRISSCLTHVKGRGSGNAMTEATPYMIPGAINIIGDSTALCVGWGQGSNHMQWPALRFNPGLKVSQMSGEGNWRSGYDPTLVTNRGATETGNTYWLSDPARLTQYNAISGEGRLISSAANNTYGIRPFCVFGKAA